MHGLTYNKAPVNYFKPKKKDFFGNRLLLLKQIRGLSQTDVQITQN